MLPPHPCTPALSTTASPGQGSPDNSTPQTTVGKQQQLENAPGKPLCSTGRLRRSQGYAGFLYTKANRRFLAYLGQLTTAFKLSSHLILQTSCKQSVKKKGSAEESRAQGFQTSNLNPKGRNKIEIKGEHRDPLNNVCCFTHSFLLCSVHQTRARRRWKKRQHEELCREAICVTHNHISLVSRSQQRRSIFWSAIYWHFYLFAVN